VSRLRPDGTWQTFTTQDGLADNDVLSIAVGPDASLWFGTWGGGVSRYRLR
jgi:ligand-binding sensor domain-containing protein